MFGWRWYRGRASIDAKVRTVRASAEAGDAEAEAKLGTAYLRGIGVPQDYEEALRWYRRSAEQGSAHGEAGLGIAYCLGYGVTPDDTESMKWYRKAADKGDAAGETGVGYLYEYGQGVTQDHAEALRWYRKAAEQGQRLAERELANLYYDGRGVPQDYGQAFGWYRKAAEQGDVPAEYAVGYMYRYGKGVQVNRSEGARWLRRAAQDRDPAARRLVSMSLGPISKWTLLIQLVGGMLLTFNFLWERRDAANVSRFEQRFSTAAGVVVLVSAGVSWYGYTHQLIWRLGFGVNAFTCVHWAFDVLAVVAAVYVIRMSRREKPIFRYFGGP